jgi:hypothetical protein
MKDQGHGKRAVVLGGQRVQNDHAGMAASIEASRILAQSLAGPDAELALIKQQVTRRTRSSACQARTKMPSADGLTQAINPPAKAQRCETASLEEQAVIAALCPRGRSLERAHPCTRANVGL